MTLWKAQKIDARVSEGPAATRGEVFGSAFDRDAPEAGFAPDMKFEEEAFKPFLDFAGQFVGLETPSDRAGRPEGSPVLRVPPELEQKLTATMTSPIGTPEFRGLDLDTVEEFTAWATANGVEVPADLTPGNLARRRERLLNARDFNITNADEIASRASPFDAAVFGFAGSVAAQFTDPGNVLTLPIGASARAGLLATVAVEAGVNAAMEVAQTPGRNRYRAAIGQEETSMVENALVGAAFGGIFGAAAKGAGKLKRPVMAGARAIGNVLATRPEKRTVAKAAAASPDPETRVIGEAVLRDIEDEEAAVTTPDDSAAIREHEARAQAAVEAAISGKPIEIPDRPAIAVPRQSIVNGEIEEVDPRALLVQPEVFQFKSDIVAPGGVTPKLLKNETWMSERAGVVLVYEYPDGSRAIADGHQRTGLANRIMDRDPSQSIKLAARVFRAADGFSVEDVRVAAALKNIAEAADGMTTKMAVDAAKVLRIRPEAIKDLPTGPGIARANELSRLSDEAFDLVINRVLPPDQAAMIGRLAPDVSMHGPLAKLLVRTAPDTAAQAESIINQALQAPIERSTVADLFGETEVAESLYLERAKVLERTMRLMRDDRQLAKTLTEKSKRVETIGKNRLDQESNQALRETMEKAMTTIAALAHRVGPISEALNDAARRYKEDGRLGDAADRVRAIVRDEIERNGLAGAGNGAAGRAAKPQGQSAAAPDPNAGFSELTGPAIEEQIQATRIETTPEDRAAANKRDLQAMLENDAPPFEIEAHPMVVKALAAMTERAKNETRNRPGYDSDEWHDSRRYVFGREEVIGTEAAAARWLVQAREFAGPDGPATDKVATIILGPPAAGKSDIAESLALTKRSAILDSDEIKKTLPEYERGIGAAAVHEESSDLANILERALVESGVNVMVPKVGGSPASIRKAIARFKAAGYTVEVINMAVTADNAYRRMIGRFISTGRIIPPDYVREVGESPSATFRTLKEEGLADGYAEIDNNGAKGAVKPVREISGRNPIAGSRFDLPGSGGQGSDAIAGAGADLGQLAQSELTPAGQQSLIPGVEPITARDRLQAKANAPLKARPRGSDTEIGGLFDPNDPSRFDLFDLVPTGRTFNDEGDEVPLVVSRADLAADLDAEDEAVSVVEICVRGATK